MTLTFKWPWKLTWKSNLSARLNVPRCPLQFLTWPFFCIWRILGAIWIYRLKWLTLYINYIGDGDTKTLKALRQWDVWRWSSNYKNYKKKRCTCKKTYGYLTESRQEKNEGGKGSGKLINALINNLLTYYGLAIVRNSDSVDAIKANAIWATFYYKCSTDENPQHNKCPPRESLWCKWKQAETNNVLSKCKHSAPLTSQVQEVIRPIYEDLSSDNLLKQLHRNIYSAQEKLLKLHHFCVHFQWGFQFCASNNGSHGN